MGTVQICEKLLNRISRLVRRVCLAYGEYKNITRKKALWSNITVDADKQAETEVFFRQNYGKKVSLKWHRLYSSYTGKYCMDYFPEILFSIKLEPILNPCKEAEFLGDKNLLEPFFSGVKGVRIPKTHLSCVRGVLRGGGGELTDVKTAVEQLRSVGKCVIKKTIGSSSGRDVMICDFSREANEIQILQSFGNDFVVQEWISQNPEISALNPTSLNTFRVMTYFCNGKLYCCPLSLRLGRSNADRDNIHYGGIGVGVNKDGTLKEYAFSEYGEKFSAHPDTGVVFKGYRITGADASIREAAMRLHARMPYLGILSWDIGIDSEGSFVLIEVNTYGQAAWLSQMINGEALFGENTAEMLKKIRGK